ncbi:MAG: hypothetical protein WD226_09000 [Planctomycetota bacterium]
MQRSTRLFLSLFGCVACASFATAAIARDAERAAALERARVEQVLVLSERTARMLGQLHDVPDLVFVHGAEEGR